MIKEISVATYDALRSGMKNQHKSSIVEITLPLETPIHKIFIVMCSITLTPGTTVVCAEDNKLVIHCLTEANASIVDMFFVNKILSFAF